MVTATVISLFYSGYRCCWLSYLTPGFPCHSASYVEYWAYAAGPAASRATGTVLPPPAVVGGSSTPRAAETMPPSVRPRGSLPVIGLWIVPASLALSTLPTFPTESATTASGDAVASARSVLPMATPQPQLAVQSTHLFPSTMLNRVNGGMSAHTQMAPAVP